MNETKANTLEAARALTSYIDEMLHLEAEPPDVEPEIGCGVNSLSHEWRIFDFGSLKACIPADLLSGTGNQVPECTVEASTPDSEWLHWAHVQGQEMALIDFRKLVLPATSQLVSVTRNIGDCRIWQVCGHAIGFVIESSVSNQISVCDGIHRCGPDRRRKWLAGTDLDTRSVFLDIDGLVCLVEASKQ